MWACDRFAAVTTPGAAWYASSQSLTGTGYRISRSIRPRAEAFYTAAVLLNKLALAGSDRKREIKRSLGEFGRAIWVFTGRASLQIRRAQRDSICCTGARQLVHNRLQGQWRGFSGRVRDYPDYLRIGKCLSLAMVYQLANVVGGEVGLAPAAG